MASVFPVSDCGETSYCVFCYRTQNKDGKSQSSTDLSLFLVMIQRYLGIPVKLNNLLELDNISEHGENIPLPMVPCETCSSIVSSFNELYHEMKCTELRIHMTLRSLVDVMEVAGKVGSRKRPLKKLFGEDQFRKLATNRENWKTYCSTRLKNLPPTLNLESMSPAGMVSNESLQTQESKDPVTAHNFNLIQEETLTHWMISAILLGLLLLDNLSDDFQDNIKLDPDSFQLESVEKPANEHADIKLRETAQYTPIVVKESDINLTDWDDSNDFDDHMMDSPIDTDISVECGLLPGVDLDLGQPSGFEEVANELASGSLGRVKNSIQMEFSTEETMEVVSLNGVLANGANDHSLLTMESGNLGENGQFCKLEIKPTITDQKLHVRPNDDEEFEAPETTYKRLKRIQVKNFFCNICNKPFPTYYSLSRHKKRSVAHLLQVRLGKSRQNSRTTSIEVPTGPVTIAEKPASEMRPEVSTEMFSPEVAVEEPAPQAAVERPPEEASTSIPPLEIATEKTPHKEVRVMFPSASEVISSPETEAGIHAPKNDTEWSPSKVPAKIRTPVVTTVTPPNKTRKTSPRKTAREKSPPKSSKEKRVRLRTVSNNESETGHPDTSIPAEPSYNLRRRRSSAVQKPDSKQDSNSESGSEDDFTCSSDSDDYTSDSSEVSEEETGSKHTPRKRARSIWLTCKICSFHTDVQNSYDFHLKLHEPGDFECSICEEKATTALELCHHELKHGKISTSGPYKCSRCPYSAKLQTPYIFHFAQEHLNVTGRSTKFTCPICKLTISYRHRERHLRRYHNTEGIATEKILTCPEENCKAYFLNVHGLRRHRAEIHAWKDLYSCVDDPNADLAEVVEKVGMKCKICQKTYNSALRFRRHCNQYHNSDETSLKLHRRFVCPVRTCAATFKTQNFLDLHSKLHGSFNCANCRFQSNFVVDLMNHEINCRNLKLSTGFKCPNCIFCSKSSSDLIDHRLEVHKGLKWRLFECKVCSARFPNVKDRYIHFSNSHGKKTRDDSVPCDNCPAYFFNKKQLAKHLKSCPGIESDKERAFCRKCDEQFKNSKEFEIHSHFHGKWNCQFCQIENEFAPDLANHELENHSNNSGAGNKVFCSRCKWSGAGNIKGNPHFVKHFLSNHLKLSTKVYQCGQCAEGFYCKDGIRTHVRNSHLGASDQFKCDLCQGMFLTKFRLVYHKRVAHVETEIIQFKCDKCGKCLKSRETLRAHKRKMHDLSRSNKFPCDQPDCGRSFGTEDELIFHTVQCKDLIQRKLQAKEIIFCEICGKSFRGALALKIHGNFHKTERPSEWKCGKCNKTFKLKTQLQTHEEYHKGPDHWKFMCAVCSKKCPNKDKLKEHMRTHTKEKPFVCQVCGEKYAHKHNLQNHIKSKHKEVQLEIKKHVQRPGVSRKGKKLGMNFCFMRENDLQEKTLNDA